MLEPQNQVDIKKLLSMNTDNIRVQEINKPNFDRMAEAFYKLLHK